MTSIFGGSSNGSSSPSPSVAHDIQSDGGFDLTSNAQVRSDPFEELGESEHENISTSGKGSPDQDSQTDSEEDIRPNRFQGSARKWQQYTTEERGLWASLEQSRADDLAVHLYNSHTLKKRKRSTSFRDRTIEQLSISSKEDWNAKDKHYVWAPKAGWTAWPLRPELVPRSPEKFGVPDEDDEGTIRMKRPWKPSAELEEVLEGVIMKKAKTRWVAHGGLVNGRTGEEAGKKDNTDAPSEKDQDDSVPVDNQGASSSETEERTFHSAAEAFDSKQMVILADEEKARALIQPTVRSILSKFDDLLRGIQRSWEGHYGDSDTEENADTSGREHRSRTHLRSRKRPSKHRSASQQTNTSALENRTKHRRTGRPKGRPKRFFGRLEGESYHNMHKRLGEEIRRVRDETSSEEQRTSVQSGSSDSEKEGGGPEVVQPPTVRRLIRRFKAPPSQKAHDEGDEGIGKTQLAEHSSEPETDIWHLDPNLRDWSEVLGIAALTGWDPRVIERTAKRCGELFGEGMRFNVMGSGRDDNERSVLVGSGSRTTTALSDAVDCLNEIQAPYLGLDPRLCCPVETCPWHRKEFSRVSKKTRHVRMQHGDVATEDVDQGDTLIGGVHLDGFLQIIPQRTGWKGKQSGSKGRTDESSEDESSQDESSQDESSQDESLQDRSSEDESSEDESSSDSHTSEE